MSPGLIALYWLAASFTATALWCAACEITRRINRRRTR